MTGDERKQDRPEIHRPKAHRSRDSQLTAEVVLPIGDFLRRFVELPHDAPRPPVERDSFVGGHDPAGRAVQQLHSERRFEIGDALAHHRLGEPQAFSRGADTAGFDHLQEGCDVVKVVAHVQE
jgi:hypothetical protein